MRLCLEKLLTDLNIQGENLNIKIPNAKLPEKISLAADAVRLFGNSGIHPGEIQLEQDTEIVPALFKLINYIVELMISLPNMSDKIFDKLPANSKKQIIINEKI